MNLYYEVYDKGYHIYDHDDSLLHIHQYEPYIPNRNLSYEENAQAQIDEIIAAREAAEQEQTAMEQLQQQVADQNQQITDLQLALCDVYEQLPDVEV